MLIQFTIFFVFFNFIICSDKKESGIPKALIDYDAGSFEKSGLSDYKDWTQCPCLMVYNHRNGKVTEDPFPAIIEFRRIHPDEVMKFIEPVSKIQGCVSAVLYHDFNIKAYFKGKTLPLSDISEIFKGVKNVSVTTDFVEVLMKFCDDGKSR